MFYESGTQVKVRVGYDIDGWSYRLGTQGMSSPVSYMGNIKMENLKGEAFLYDTEVIVVNMSDSISYICNTILSKYNYGKGNMEVIGEVVGHLDMGHFYKQVEEKFNVEAENNAKYKIKLKLNYKQKYDDEVIKNKKYKGLIDKYIKIQTDLQDLKEEIENTSKQ